MQKGKHDMQDEITTSNQKVALIIGAGDATGGAIAKRFAKGGYISCMTVAMLTSYNH